MEKVSNLFGQVCELQLEVICARIFYEKRKDCPDIVLELISSPKFFADYRPPFIICSVSSFFPIASFLFAFCLLKSIFYTV